MQNLKKKVLANKIISFKACEVPSIINGMTNTLRKNISVNESITIRCNTDARLAITKKSFVIFYCLGREGYGLNKTGPSEPIPQCHKSMI